MLPLDLCFFPPLFIMPYLQYPLAHFVISIDLFSNVILSKRSSLNTLYKIPSCHHHQSLSIHSMDCTYYYLTCYIFLEICFDFVDFKTDYKLKERDFVLFNLYPSDWHIKESQQVLMKGCVNELHNVLYYMLLAL